MLLFFGSLRTSDVSPGHSSFETICRRLEFAGETPVSNYEEQENRSVRWWALSSVVAFPTGGLHGILNHYLPPSFNGTSFMLCLWLFIPSCSDGPRELALWSSCLRYQRALYFQGCMEVEGTYAVQGNRESDMPLGGARDCRPRNQQGNR